MTTQVDPKGLFARLTGRLKRSGSKAVKLVAKSEPDLHDYWLCGDWFPTKRRGVYYFYKHKYVDYRKGDLLSLPKTKNGWPIYRVTGWRKTGYDNAGFDDGRKYNLEFVRYSTKPKIPNERIMAR